MGTLKALTSFVVVSLVSSVAHAGDPGTISIGGVCMPPGTSSAEVLRILQAELAPNRVRTMDDAATPRGDADVVLTVTDCTDTPSGAHVAVWQHGETSELSVTLTDATPTARSRTFALALAESIRSALATPPDPGYAIMPIAKPVKDAPESETTGRDHGDGLSLLGSAAFRFVPKSTTPLGGADLGVAGNRFAVGATVLGTERSTSLGSVGLFTVAGFATADFVELTSVLRLRAGAELGVAIASGSANANATGHTVAGPHTALDAGFAAVFPVDARWSFEGFAGAGYASSLRADAAGRSAAGLDGVFVTIDLGVRLPVQL